MRKLIISTSLALATMVGSVPALACLNGVIMERDDAVRSVARAETALAHGNYHRVLSLLHADYYEGVGSALLRKITTLKAVAKLRLGRTRSAEKTLRRLLRNDKDNPLLRTRLAEALANRKGLDAVEAWKILHELETRDLIPDAHGYAALARLRHRAKDRQGFQRAVRNCRAMAAHPTTVCPSDPSAVSADLRGAASK